jgi:hypothetical protein
LIFDDPRRDVDLPYDSMLERLRLVRYQIELRMKGWRSIPKESSRGCASSARTPSVATGHQKGRVEWPSS